jgi:superfamily II DNA/RNA helicase
MYEMEHTTKKKVHRVCRDVKYGQQGTAIVSR